MGEGAGVDAVTGSAPAADWAALWAASGAMALTGWPDRAPLFAPDALLRSVHELGARIESASAAIGRRVALDWPALLGERAALAHLSRHGDRSCGGGTRLLHAADAWIAVTIARDEDAELLPAWLELPVDVHDPWPAVTAGVGDRPAAEVVGRAALLGLPVARLGEARHDGAPVRASCLRDAPAVRDLDGCVVVDLSSLWAGPLCAQLLGLAGARVIKVESVRRPDGARRGPREFFDLLHAGHASVALDFATPDGRSALHALVQRADVVIEASRPRALEQLGLQAGQVVTAGRCRAWVSLTGHGRDGDNGLRVALGDDAAVAGGLVARDPERGLCFCADAVADPLAGLAAAAAALEVLQRGGGWLLDVALSRCASVAADQPGHVCESDGAAGQPGYRVRPEVAPPRARPPLGVAAPLGADTSAVLSELGR